MPVQVQEIVRFLNPDSNEAERGWQERANCLGVDPDLFFPERGASTKEAKAVCRGCEVRVECLEYALSHGEKFGASRRGGDRRAGHERRRRSADGPGELLPRARTER